MPEEEAIKGNKKENQQSRKNKINKWGFEEELENVGVIFKSNGEKKGTKLVTLNGEPILKVHPSAYLVKLAKNVSLQVLAKKP